ncbi:MAG: SLC13 family permease [Proteobacteria bacterium]|nr:SLC13 family permease [Pseudomonadota bacterium]
MSWQQIVVLTGLLGLVVMLVRGRWAPAAIFSGTAFAFILLGFTSLDTSLKHLTNNGLITVVVLMLLSVVLDKSRLLETMADKLVRGPYRWALTKLYFTTAIYSAFLNNTAVVASLMGPLRGNPHHAASRVLLPMCFAATIGGTLTLVGTSTNLLVNSFLIGSQLPELKMFDLLPVGGLLLLAGGLTMWLLYPHLLKDHPTEPESAADYFVEAQVREGSPLIGKTVEEAGLRNLGHLFLTEIVRGDHVIAPVEPDRFIQAGDELVFTGDVTRIDLLARFPGLHTVGHDRDLPLDNLVEVVISAQSTLARQTLREVDFRAQFDAAVVAVRRGGERLGGSLGSIRLEVGDALVLVTGQDFQTRNNLSRNFVVVSERQVQKFIDPRKANLALAGFVAVIGLSALGVLSFLKGLLVLLAVFLALRLVKPAELRRHMPYDIILIIASALVISDVMMATGTAKVLAGALLAGGVAWGPYAALALVLLVTWIMTELMSNNAAAALTFPVALGVAEQMGLGPMPFVMAVLYGASCSFSTPYGYQTNLMVMSPGRYTLADYLRAGVPLALVFMAVCLVAVPVFFPFTTR